MLPVLRVLSPGLLTTIQDIGRIGYQHLGVAVSGALDSVSLRAANALVKNPAQAGALEVFYTGPTFLVEADSVRFGFAGAKAPIEVLRSEGDTRASTLAMQTVYLRRGEIIRIGNLEHGAVLYASIEGGFAIAPVLGSIATYIRGGFGGWQGRALVAGDQLPLHKNAAASRLEARIDGLDLSPPARFRVLPGPQSEYFSEEAMANFFASEYTVGTDSDRMGMRLRGPKVEHLRGFDIVSDAIAPGSIQVPGDGQPIVLLADRQTTGGYPKIATVISADVPALGRMRIGSKIAFEQVTLAAAQALRRQFLEEVNRISDRIVLCRAKEQDVAAQLLTSNLISGVLNGLDWS